MQDILGLNNTSGATDSGYINHSSQQKRWLSGGEPIEISSFLVDPDTIRTGWGMYDGEYHYVWDDKPGVSVKQPGPDFKRAFSVWVFIPQVGPKLWRRFTWGEGQGFNALCSLFWNDINIKKGSGEVPYVDYLGAKQENFKVGSSCIPQFRMREWVRKPDSFVIPNPAEAQDTSDDYPFPPQKPKPQTFNEMSPPPVTDEDLPF